MHQQPSALFHFPGSDAGGLWFRNAGGIVATSDVSHVRDALADVAAAVRRGAYAAGFLSYESAPAFDDSLPVKLVTDFPLLWFGVFDAPETGPGSTPPDSASFTDWIPEISRSRYARSFERISEAIRAGETYQVNSTFRLRSQFSGDPLACYLSMRGAHPGDYNAYIDTGDYAIVSLSPELMFDLETGSDGARATTKPMKGTVRRGRWAEEDREQARSLFESAKDRAENIMIVDLMRNDFGKIATVGSVNVPTLFDIEALPTVWQMTSTVQCTLPRDADFATTLGAIFPAGSITGAPKGQSMKIIAETEMSPRKVYCGTVGYAAPIGRAVFNVAIRTVLIDRRTGEAECGIGGGITADSDCNAEYEEAIAKSLFLSTSSEPFDFLETLLLENGDYFLLERHLGRLKDSAEYFDIAVDVESVRDLLAEHARDMPAGRLRVRLAVTSTGVLSVTTAELPKDNPATVQVNLAERAIHTDTPFIFNKTTRREHYHAFHKSGGDTFDTLLYNGRGELTEFTTGNVVAKIGDSFYTPPITCGLLPGTFRAELIAQGKITEGVLMKDHISDFEEIWFINSVRKWVRVIVQQ